MQLRLFGPAQPGTFCQIPQPASIVSLYLVEHSRKTLLSSRSAPPGLLSVAPLRSFPGTATGDEALPSEAGLPRLPHCRNPKGMRQETGKSSVRGKKSFVDLVEHIFLPAWGQITFSLGVSVYLFLGESEVFLSVLLPPIPHPADPCVFS